MEHWRNLQAEDFVRVQAQERGKCFAFRILLLRVGKLMYIGSYTVCMLVMLLICALMHTGSYTIQCVHTCGVLKIDRHVFVYTSLFVQIIQLSGADHDCTCLTK